MKSSYGTFFENHGTEQDRTYTHIIQFNLSFRRKCRVLFVQKVLSSSGRATRRWPVYFPIRRSLPARTIPFGLQVQSSANGRTNGMYFVSCKVYSTPLSKVHWPFICGTVLRRDRLVHLTVLPRSFQLHCHFTASFQAATEWP